MRASFRDDKPLNWVRVHDLPDFVYFNHSIHVRKGVGCETCHGRVDRMPLMIQKASLQMEWCLDCHRDPSRYVRPRDQITTMGYVPAVAQAELGPQPRARIQDRRQGTLDQLLGVPPMTHSTQSTETRSHRSMIAKRRLELDDRSARRVRARCSSSGGPQVWRSLDEVAETPEFKDYLHREFPSNASEWLDPVGRRSFLKLMSASMALAGVTACTVQPQELIVPYVRQPEEEIPGKPLFFATAITLGGVASGLLVESHEGRPTKIEGNPDHPASKGATDLFAQGSVLTLYDPDRSQTILQLGEIRPWSAAMAAIRGGLSAQSASKGAGLRILTETVASPTLAAQIQQVLSLHPSAKWIQWEPVNRDNARAGARTAFGQYVEPLYDLTKADVILSLDADFLASDGAHNLHYMRQFATRRRVEESADNLNRLYVVESDHTVTGGRADNRLPIKSSQIEAFARAVAAAPA